MAQLEAKLCGAYMRLGFCHSEARRLQSGLLSKSRHTARAHISFLQSLKPDPEFKFTLADAQAFLDFINRNPTMQPWGFNPMAVYLFVSEHCFTANCDLWLVPCLRRLDYPVRIMVLEHGVSTYCEQQKLDGWNPARVYQMLMQLPLFSNDSDARYKFMYESLDSRFHVVVSETAEHRTFLNEVKNELYRPLPRVVGPECTESMDDSVSDADSHWDAASDSDESESDWDAAAASRSKLKPPPPPQNSSRTSGSSCPYCYNLPERKQCIRVLYVTRRPCRHLIGNALTCAPPNQYLQPKPVNFFHDQQP
jgi:hypothetical protein